MSEANFTIKNILVSRSQWNSNVGDFYKPYQEKKQ